MLFYFLLHITGAAFSFCASSIRMIIKGILKKTKWTDSIMEKELTPKQGEGKRILLLIKKLDAKTLEIWCFFT